uniref:GLOBIN domain-containing protein n=1 Tax=Angiostrongylus cantonensis TaxID=6313 RepID=A0A0K0DLL8_ANGCA
MHSVTAKRCLLKSNAWRIPQGLTNAESFILYLLLIHSCHRGRDLGYFIDYNLSSVNYLATFSQMNPGGMFLKLMEQVFRRLEAKYPDIRSIFLTTAFVNSLSREKCSPPLVRTEHDHCKCVVSLFEKIIENLNGDECQLNAIRPCGEKHAQSKRIEIRTKCELLQDVVKYNHEAVKAWRLLLAYVTDEMMVGFDRLNRLSERKCNGVDMCLKRT